MRIILDDANGYSLQVYKESDPSKNLQFSYPMLAGQTWRFYHTIWANVDYIDDYREFDLGNTYTYVPSLAQQFSDTFDSLNGDNWNWQNADHQAVINDG